MAKGSSYRWCKVFPVTRTVKVNWGDPMLDSYVVLEVGHGRRLAAVVGDGGARAEGQEEGRGRGHVAVVERRVAVRVAGVDVRARLQEQPDKVVVPVRRSSVNWRVTLRVGHAHKPNVCRDVRADFIDFPVRRRHPNVLVVGHGRTTSGRGKGCHTLNSNSEMASTCLPKSSRQAGSCLLVNSTATSV